MERTAQPAAPAVALSRLLPVLLTGPSGAGKRSAWPWKFTGSRAEPKSRFVSVNCSALSDTIGRKRTLRPRQAAASPAPPATAKARSKLRAAAHSIFGRDRRRSPDRFAAEVVASSAKNRQIRPVGSDQNTIDNRRPASLSRLPITISGKEVDDGDFRADLFFRLHVVQMQKTPRASQTDGGTSETLLYHFSKAHRVGFSFPAIQNLTDAFVAAAICRELKNMVARSHAYFPDRRKSKSRTCLRLSFQARLRFRHRRW